MNGLGLGVLMGAALFAACFVDRPSETYTCTSNADCTGFTDGRQCKSGYCVVPNCPADCTSCDEEQRTCIADCTSSDSCGSVTCPTGWTCTINCVGGNACSNVTCLAGADCTITCSGTDACETVDCAAACKCDLSCVVGDECNTPDCPTVGNGANQTHCTSDGTTATSCDSAHAAGCTKC
ncbi:MAG TPA: hypothetical protein VIV40_41955 [Kofleriaceae bacterium]